MNNIQQQRAPSRRHQGGFTLVELMVSLFISLAMVGGIIVFASSNKGSYTIQNELGRLQENSRFALDTLSRNIGSAGFRITEPVAPAVGILAFGPVNTPLDDATSNGTLNLLATGNFTGDFATMFTGDGTGMGSDVLIMNKESVVGATDDCLGQAVTVGATITNVYYIADLDANNLFDLYCEGYENGLSSGAPQTLVEGVDNMQLLYGEDTNNDNTADRFVSAINVIDWQRIMAVRVALLMSTLTPLPTGEIETDTYRLLNAPTMGPFNDGENRIRRVFTKTILIRSNAD